MCPTLIQREWHNTRPRGRLLKRFLRQVLTICQPCKNTLLSLTRQGERVLMLEQAITELQNIEQSVARKTLSDLQIHLALRSCLKELRALSVACHPPRVSSLATDRRTGSSFVTKYESACPSGSAEKVLGIDGKLCSAKDFALHRFPYCWQWGVSMRITSALYALTAFSSVSRSGRPFWALGSPPGFPILGYQSLTKQYQ